MAAQSKSAGATALAQLSARLRQPGSPRTAAVLVAAVVALLLARTRGLLAQRRHLPRRKPAVDDAQLAQALEQLYIPHTDGSRTLLVPYHQRVSKVSITPTPEQVIDANSVYFRSIGILDDKAVKKARVNGEKKDAAAIESQIIRQQGGAANAGARKVGVNKAFFQQLRAIFRILMPKLHNKATYVLLLHTFFLVLRTYLSVLVARLDGKIVGDLVSANGRGFLKGLGLWFLLAIPSTYTNSMIRYLQSKLAIGFRTRLTRYVHDLYLSPERNYYKLINLDGRQLGRADQFITYDVAKFCDALASLYSNVSKPVLDLLIFNYQLGRALGGTGVLQLFASYFVTGWLLRKISPAFGKLAAVEAALEGDFRAAHTNIITSAEEIAFYEGAGRELGILNGTYAKLVRHVKGLLKIRISYVMCEDMILKYGWSAAGYMIIAWPFLFGRSARDERHAASAAKDGNEEAEGDIAKGTESYISNRRLLLSLADAGSRLMYSYKELAELAGYTSRVYTLLATLHLLNRNVYQAQADAGGKRPKYDLAQIQGKFVPDPELIDLEHVPIVAPAPTSAQGGEELIKAITLAVEPGNHLMITGANGVGKTAIARILAGLWPVFAGVTRAPLNEPTVKGGVEIAPYTQGRGMLFLPQRPYLSNGSLRDQVIYPSTYAQHVAMDRTDEELEEVLKLVHLAYLPAREGGWATRKEWKDVLSGGEKQRVSFARLLYHRPRFGVLDEATSAVSSDVEGLMYTAAKDLGVTLITISHRPGLTKYHTSLLKLGGKDAHGWELTKVGGEEERLEVSEEVRELEARLQRVEQTRERIEQIREELQL